MDSDQEDEVPNVNFVPSLLFIKRGVAKANPDKVRKLLLLYVSAMFNTSVDGCLFSKQFELSEIEFNILQFSLGYFDSSGTGKNHQRNP